MMVETVLRRVGGVVMIMMFTNFFMNTRGLDGEDSFIV